MKQCNSFLFKLCLSGMLLALAVWPPYRAQEKTRTAETGYIIDTIAGGGPLADLIDPYGVAVDDAGNIYYVDFWDHRVLRIDPSGGIPTIVAGTGPGEGAGGAGGYGGDGGPAVEAQLYGPRGVAVDSSGNLYIADSANHRIRRVDPAGTITTVAGTGSKGFSGDGGPAVQAQLDDPSGVAVDPAGNLYIADNENNRIRKVDASGTITTIAGKNFGVEVGNRAYWAVDAQLNGPYFVATDAAGNVYFSEITADPTGSIPGGGNFRIRKVDVSGIMTTVAGNGKRGFSGDGGPGAEAMLHGPGGVATDAAGNVYFADRFNHRIRRVDASGIISTIAGSGGYGTHEEGGFSGDGGPAVEARLNIPIGVAVDSAGNVYVADSENHRIRVLAQPPATPTHLTARAVSFQEINLTWRDDSLNETGFRVQRRWEGSANWLEIGTVSADTTTFSDSGLEPATTYLYRVQAFNRIVASDFSSEASATTPRLVRPTVARFAPAKGLVGTRVTITGTHFLGATAVQFNGVSALEFEVLSATSIQAVVPPGATSGPISVVTPGGRGVSANSFTVATDTQSSLFVPVVLRARGHAGSFFTTELTLANRGSRDTPVRYTYRSATGAGSGSAVDSLGAGRQRTIPDAIAYLASLGVPIGRGSAHGTLKIDFTSLSALTDASVTLRVGTPVEEGRGRAGLSYTGLSPEGLLTGSAVVAGLRQNSQDRSNLAVQHAGNPNDGSIALRVTVFSGDSAAPGRRLVLPDRTLNPGGFYQYNGILNTAGFKNGYVKVERVSGRAPFYVYGVINDNFNSDGSFVFPVREESLVGKRGQTLPVIIESGAFNSELTVTNFSNVEKTLDFRFVADAIRAPDDSAKFSLRLEAGEQSILPHFVDWLRRRQVTGIGPAGSAHVGALFATVAKGDMSGIVIGARTGAPDNKGGQYGLFYNGVPYGSASVESAWIYGLQQNAENRSNLALVNTGEIDDTSSTFEITIYDGSGESQPRTKSVTLGPRRWTQENGILGRISQGYVQVRKVSGNNPFVTYGVINDGGRPGERSGDGAFLLSQE